MAKVIDFVSRLRTIDAENVGGSVNVSSSSLVPSAEDAGAVINLAEKKQTMLFQERRHVKRTILSDLVSAMLVIPEKGLLKVDIHDISEDGVSFDLDTTQGTYKVGEELYLRVYVNQKSYFPVALVVKHITECPEEGIARHGAEYLKSDSDNVALRHFIKFIETASQGLKSDDGDLMTNKTS